MYMGRFSRHKPLQFKDYSSRKFFLSILLGLVTILIFYFFQQYLFSLYRYASIALMTFKFNVNSILPDDYVDFLSFLFAGNAVILGNSVCIAFYMSRTSKDLKRRSRRRNILNNQSFLVGNYFFWFSEVFFFVAASPLLFSRYQMFEEIKVICILLFIVLFLESTKGLRRSFNGYTIKILLLHFLLLLVLVFSCSLFKKSNYNRLGNVYNISHPYVSIPKTLDTVSFENKVLISRYGNYCDISVKVIHDTKSIRYKLFGNEVSITELINASHDYKCASRGHKDPEFFVYADGGIKYHRLKELEREATLRGMFVICYAIHAVNESNDFLYPKILYPTKALYMDAEKSKLPPPPVVVYFEEYLQDKKEQVLDLDSFILKDKVHRQSVYDYFQKSVSDSVFFKLKINKEITLQQYLDFMISYKQSVYDLRDEQKRMNNALNNYKINERLKYPFYFIEEID